MDNFFTLAQHSYNLMHASRILGGDLQGAPTIFYYK